MTTPPRQGKMWFVERLRFDATPAGATDAESGEALQVRDGAVVVPMNAYGARVVTIQ